MMIKAATMVDPVSPILVDLHFSTGHKKVRRLFEHFRRSVMLTMHRLIDELDDMAKKKLATEKMAQAYHDEWLEKQSRKKSRGLGASGDRAIKGRNDRNLNENGKKTKKPRKEKKYTQLK